LTPSTDQINFWLPAVGEAEGATHAVTSRTKINNNPTLIVSFLSMAGLLSLGESEKPVVNVDVKIAPLLIYTKQRCQTLDIKA
jgi:hypothetical protein